MDGIRCGELMALMPSDFLLETSELRIDKSCQRLRGEDVVVFVKTVVSWVARKTFRPGTASFHVRQGMPLSAFS